MNVFIENVQVLTKEWIDVLIFTDTKHCFRMYCVEEKGTYLLIENKLYVEWEKWGCEVFEKISFGRNHFLFVNLNDSNYYEIPLITDEWNDIGVIDFKNKILFRKSFPSEKGKPLFEKNKLHIYWEKYGQETFYANCHGKFYVHSKLSECNVNEKKEVKAIAIVFPQYHEIPENNQFWGQGFTEWSLLSKVPDEVHGELVKKPHDDIGYYNILDYSHRCYMKAIADKYNIHGFCYYHYWFKNKKVMYKPLEKMLEDGQPDKPFMFCWANEQWTRRWDGGNDEILLEQDYSDEQGNREHFEYLLQFFKHKNYIKENNKPIFIFYRIEEKDIESIRKIIHLWNDLAKKNNLPGIQFMRFLGPFDNRFNIDEIEGGVEFEPGYATSSYYSEIVMPDEVKIFNEYDEILYLQKNRDVRQMILHSKFTSGHEHYSKCNEREKDVRRSEFFVYDGNVLYDKIINLPKTLKIQHRGINVQWNNVPRRNYSNGEYEKYPHIFKYINPDVFGKASTKLLEKINNSPNPMQDFLFVSSWNEWNEQCVLEPNNIDGYDYLSSFQKNYLKYYGEPKRKSILVFGHIGGGTYKHMKDLEYIFPEHNFIYYNQFDKPVNLVERFPNINAIHIHSFLLQSFTNDSLPNQDNYSIFIEKIKLFKEKFPSTIIYLTIHDYQWFFPENPNIKTKYFINSFPDDQCNKNFLTICLLANKIIFPDSKIISQYQTKISLEPYFEKIFITPHMDILYHHNNKCIPKIDESCIRIGFVGNFCDYKGAKKFIELAMNKKNIKIDGKELIIEYHIFGLSQFEITEQMPLFYHGNYEEKNLIGYLHHKKIHGICHISEFDESYCYALTYSIMSGLPICYNENGCFQSRLGNNSKYTLIYQDNLINDFDKFLKYIYFEQDVHIYNYNMSPNVQPSKWYILHYMEELKK